MREMGVKVAGDATSPFHRELVTQITVAERFRRPNCWAFFRKAGVGDTQSNALIAALVNILAEQMAIHAVAGEMDEAERSKVFEVTTAALYQNFLRLFEKHQAAYAAQVAADAGKETKQ